MSDYKKQYIDLCLKLNDCTTKEDVMVHNAAMKKLAKLYRQIESIPDKSCMLELLGNEDSRVKYLAAAHCLGMNIYIIEAQTALRTVAKGTSNPVIAFNARSTLEVWRKQGFLRF